MTRTVHTTRTLHTARTLRPAAPEAAIDSSQVLPVVDEVAFVTGFPAFTARRVAAQLLATDPRARLALLVREKFARDAERFLAELPDDAGRRAEIVVGDVCDMDLGLSGAEYRELAAHTTTIHHLAGIYHLGVERAVAERVNVEGTRGVIELAGECRRLRRLCHYSTAQVSGKRKGVVLEEELESGQTFFNAYEATKFAGEKLARAAARRLPVTILRPGVIVGDSRTGEIDRFDGPYYLLRLIVASPEGVRLPLPGRGAAPLHIVPVDYVTDAALALSRDERAAGGTFHLTDPNPLPARRIYELIAERAQRRPPRGFLPGRLARAVMRAPGLERFARAPRTFLEGMDHLVFYNTRRTQALLAGTGIECPPFESYVEHLVRYVRDAHAAHRRLLEDEVFDPFA
ncbi:MAG: NAD-dependent epimerase/dehydratase family protein [Myxococcales bacterium]|nr:NAD-dependent epimerase/dehydratase family protein [Myxococcales bacterium]